MNPLLAHYGVAVHHPEVSGAEHLELLQIRDQLAGLEPLLTAEELEALGVADAILAAQPRGSSGNSNGSSTWRCIVARASIMAPATPFCFCTTQKHLAVKRVRSSRA